MSNKQVILITGASSGIGRELARLLAGQGYILYVNARRGDELQALVDEFPEQKIVPLKGDLTDREFRATLIDTVIEAEARLDILINNAGFGNIGSLDDLEVDRIRNMIELNVIALIELTKDAVEVMKKQGSGRILNVSSLVGFLTLPYNAVYTASKHAVNGFTETLRYELKGTGVTASAINPGTVDTEFGVQALGQNLPKSLRGASPQSIAKSIVRQLHKNRRWLFPSIDAHLLYWAFRWVPCLLHLAFATVGRKVMKKMITDAKASPKELT